MKNKILLLDNSTTIFSPWKKVINQYYDCTEAIGGFESLSKLKNNDFKLVIVNLSIDKMNGVEAIEKIRSKYESIPIIVLYAPKDILNLKQAMVYRIQHALKLPIDHRELIIEARKYADIESIRLTHNQDTPSSSVSSIKKEANFVDVEAKFYEALSAVAGNQINHAIQIYDNLLSLTNIKKEGWRRYIEESLFHLGQCYSRLQDFEKANKYYKEFICKVPHHNCVKESILYLGQNYQAMKDYNRASAYYKKVINMKPFDSFSTQASKLLKKIPVLK
ncbi:MAG: response regulator [Spirochaetales bacterium]|nr:response regulator [Spirochaetales bacterium]